MLQWAIISMLETRRKRPCLNERNRRVPNENFTTEKYNNLDKSFSGWAQQENEEDRERNPWTWSRITEINLSNIKNRLKQKKTKTKAKANTKPEPQRLLGIQQKI